MTNACIVPQADYGSIFCTYIGNSALITPAISVSPHYSSCPGLPPPHLSPVLPLTLTSNTCNSIPFYLVPLLISLSHFHPDLCPLRLILAPDLPESKHLFSQDFG